MTTLHVS